MNKIIKIEYLKDNLQILYENIGEIHDTSDGFFYLWPQNTGASIFDWRTTLATHDIASKLYAIGSLLNVVSIDNLSSEMNEFVIKNKEILTNFCNKYFSDYEVGLIHHEEIFLPFNLFNEIYELGEGESNEKDEEYIYKFKRGYKNGGVLYILNSTITWDELNYTDIFIKVSHKRILEEDLKKIINLLSD